MIPAPAHVTRRFNQNEHSVVLPTDAKATRESTHEKALTKGESQPMKTDHRKTARERRPESTGTPPPDTGRQPRNQRAREPGREPIGGLLAAGYGLVADSVTGTASGAAAQLNKDLARYLFWTVAGLAVALVTMNLAAEAAFAQQAGQDTGDAIGQTLANVRNYLAGLAFGVGGIGFVASLLVKGYASINENAHAYAAMGMKGSLWCIVAGVIVTPILSIAAGLAGGGGGGGGGGN